MIKAGSEYLRFDRRDEIGGACCMASSAVDAMRAGPEARAAFGARLRDLAALVESNGVQSPLPMLATAVGALTLARASDDELAEDLLRQTLEMLQQSLE